jgi:hypothetical protein
MPSNGLFEGVVFVSEDFFQGKNLRFVIGQRQRLCIVVLKKVNFMCCIGTCASFLWAPLLFWIGADND